MLAKSPTRKRELEALSRLLLAAEVCADDVGSKELTKLIGIAAAMTEKELALSERYYLA